MQVQSLLHHAHTPKPGSRRRSCRVPRRRRMCSSWDFFWYISSIGREFLRGNRMRIDGISERKWESERDDDWVVAKIKISNFETAKIISNNLIIILKPNVSPYKTNDSLFIFKQVAQIRGRTKLASIWTEAYIGSCYFYICFLLFGC